MLTALAPATNATFEDWDRHRLALGLPDGTRDLETEKTVLLEAGFDELNGISWTKGCYMGQELTARTRYRGLLKRRLLPVAADGDVPARGTAVLAGAGKLGKCAQAAAKLGWRCCGWMRWRATDRRRPNSARRGAGVGAAVGRVSVA